MKNSEATTEDLYMPAPESKNLKEKTGYFYEKLVEIQNKGHYTYRRTLASASKNRVTTTDPVSGDKNEMLMFASNNYLGLSTHPQVVEAAQKALKDYGYGTGSVALLSGTSDVHRKLEQTIADFYNCESAAVFPTGYQANVGTIQAILKEKDIAISDMYAHASLIDGINLSDGSLKYFQHNDMNHLESMLKKADRFFNGKLIIVDGVFSMDGDIAPLDQIQKLAAEYNASVLVDEAHALGIIGPNGKGTAELFGLEGQVDFTIGTLSKAPSGIGGYLTGKAELVEYVRHFARSYIFSTSIPVPVAAGLIEVFNIIKTDKALREKLNNNVDYLLKGFKRLNLDTIGSQTAIIPVLVPDDIKLRMVCKSLHEKGVFATPVTFPAVAKGRSRIRFSVMATHSKEELDTLLNIMEDLHKQYDLNC